MARVLIVPSLRNYYTTTKEDHNWAKSFMKFGLFCANTHQDLNEDLTKKKKINNNNNNNNNEKHLFFNLIFQSLQTVG